MKFILRTLAFASLSVVLMSATAAQSPQLPSINTPATGETLPGKFVWFDLATPGIADQQTFYAAVFGWSFDAPVPTDDQYVLVSNQGRTIAGMFNYEPPDGEQDGATWIVLMSVPDPDQAASIVKSNGGSVEIEATNLPQRGRHALLRDPAGAIFGVLRSSSGDPFDEEIEVGGIIWVDLFAQDIEGMTQFYSALAPYEVAEREVTDTVSRKILSAHGMPRAGIVSVDEEANRSAWVPYVRVDDIAATLEKVVEGGGFAIVPPHEDLFDGNVAVFVDPKGGATGIVKYEYEEDPSP